MSTVGDKAGLGSSGVVHSAPEGVVGHKLEVSTHVVCGVSCLVAGAIAGGVGKLVGAVSVGCGTEVCDLTGLGTSVGRGDHGLGSHIDGSLGCHSNRRSRVVDGVIRSSLSGSGSCSESALEASLGGPHLSCVSHRHGQMSTVGDKAGLGSSGVVHSAPVGVVGHKLEVSTHVVCGVGCLVAGAVTGLIRELVRAIFLGGGAHVSNLHRLGDFHSRGGRRNLSLESDGGGLVENSRGGGRSSDDVHIRSSLR